MKKKSRGIVLIVEDDRNVAGLLGEWLEHHGYDVDFATDGIDALQLAQHDHYDAVVLDVSLPRLGGIEVCRQLRSCERGVVPILMVTAHDTLREKLEGLAAGADVYLTKPFFPAELEARIAVLIRRRRAQVAPAIMRLEDIVLDPQERRVTRGGRVVELTPTGFRILAILMRESPRVVTRTQLEQELWGSASPESDALRSHLYNLRKALDRGYPTPVLQTMPHVGYRVLPRAGAPTPVTTAAGQAVASPP